MAKIINKKQIISLFLNKKKFFTDRHLGITFIKEDIIRKSKIIYIIKSKKILASKSKEVN